MTDFSQLLIADRGQPAHLVHLVDEKGHEAWLSRQSVTVRAAAEAHRFDAKTAGQFVILPATGSDLFEVAAAVKDVNLLGPWCLARFAEVLPAGHYRLAQRQPALGALGWLLGQHRFARYKTNPTPDRGPRILVTNEPSSIDRTIAIADATALVRDRVDTPAADMGPVEIEMAARQMAERHGAKVEMIRGDALEQGFPMIAAVGQGATKERGPRLIELRWGDEKAPRLAIIGKGVCFDSGGLDIKPANGMRLMKKDMGGAAHALALASLVMRLGLPVRLHLLIPAVENAVSASAFRPGDIIASRKGLSVEIDNTDAEGRLVLGDALAKAVEDEPELIVDFATLTGAARVALGPDLPAMFSNDDGLAAELEQAARLVEDPLWRMPLWDGYDEMLKSDLADLSNAADSPMAGAVTAALFLRRFVPATIPWAHFDTFAWRPSAKPGRPKGGEALGLRAALAMIEQRYGSVTAPTRSA